jgi:hypothetical protein
MIELNPRGRTQTEKCRPLVKMLDTLATSFHSIFGILEAKSPSPRVAHGTPRLLRERFGGSGVIDSYLEEDSRFDGFLPSRRTGGTPHFSDEAVISSAPISG